MKPVKNIGKIAALSALLVLAFARFSLAEGLDFQDGNFDELAKPETSENALSFNDSGDKSEPGYIYFQESDTEIGDASLSVPEERGAGNISPAYAFTPSELSGATQLTAYPNMQAWLSGAFTPRYSNAHLGLGTTSGEINQGALNLQVSSSFGNEAMDIVGFIENPSLRDMVVRDNYNLSFNVGYAGFRLGAGVSRGYNVITDGYSGFDVGVGYAGRRFSTSFMVGEYSSRYNSLLPALQRSDETFYALEFGATYLLSSVISLNGGYRYLDFGSRSLLVDDYSTPSSQLFYLGTRLSF